MVDNVNYPPHYRAHASGVECIEITEHMNFCLGNAIKYIWRAGLKKDAVEDLNKAVWYINREIKRVGTTKEKGSREFIRHQYQESYRSSEWDFANLKEGSLQYPKYSIQYNTASENN